MKKKEIVAGKIRFVSLCRRGKTGLLALYKAEGQEDTLETQVILKAGEDFEEKGLLYACLYQPNVPDSQGHWASAETIEKMAHNAMAEGLQLDIYHDQKAIAPDKAGLVESTIIQKNDTRFGDSAQLVGGWGVVVRLTDPDLRARYREEDWAGTSIGGIAVTREAEPELIEKASIFSGLVRRVSSLFSSSSETKRISSPDGTYHINF